MKRATALNIVLHLTVDSVKFWFTCFTRYNKSSKNQYEKILDSYVCDSIGGITRNSMNFFEIVKRNSEKFSKNNFSSNYF